MADVPIKPTHGDFKQLKGDEICLAQMQDVDLDTVRYQNASEHQTNFTAQLVGTHEPVGVTTGVETPYVIVDNLMHPEQGTAVFKETDYLAIAPAKTDVPPSDLFDLTTNSFRPFVQPSEKPADKSQEMAKKYLRCTSPTS